MEIADLIKQTISTIDTFSDEDLVHYYKCCLTKQSNAEKKLYATLVTAIEKERRKRGSAKALAKAEEKEPNPTADMYEGEENAY